MLRSTHVFEPAWANQNVSQCNQWANLNVLVCSLIHIIIPIKYLFKDNPLARYESTFPKLASCSFAEYMKPSMSESKNNVIVDVTFIRSLKQKVTFLHESSTLLFLIDSVCLFCLRNPNRLIHGNRIFYCLIHNSYDV